MLKLYRTAAVTVALSMGLTACATLEDSQTLGGLGGALVGAAAGAALLADGSGTATTIIAGVGGGLLGGAAGRKIGKEIYKRDRASRDLAFQRALGERSRSDWVNPDTGSTGYVARTGGAWRAGEEVCAQFQEDYRPNGHPREWTTSTACLSARGWRKIS